ncbi:L-lactate MFS transporter [Caldicellulosiruptor naganoensis]|uniref:OFA family MFS transporter n=1 Tax=Caldicellulosiruptor naganoensis TaxID=29324 RepID=A0ABY7BEH9_9FIRM|nr:OFA family MFS transporter [Caldicellulosiruptor naganoensis]WAM30860.1 OFA family MFS transporter [Caldicellulosiruptor naganoensis]
MRAILKEGRVNRNIYVLLGLIMNICLGSVYSWSVFRKPLEETLDLNATQSGLPYMFFLVFYALFMPIAGRYIDKYGPRIVAIAGGTLVGIGWLVAGFSDNLLMMTIGYGIIAGSGVGIAYGVPIAVSTRWFEDKKGLAVGLTVLGFGMSPLVTAPIARRLITYFGPFVTLRVLGIIFFIVIVSLALFLKFPNQNMRRKNKEIIKETNSFTRNFTPSEMLRTSTFWYLWLCFVIGTFSGLMAIGISSPVAQEIVKLTPEMAALSVSIFAIFNGLGRPLFGFLTDKISPRYAALIDFAIIFFSSLGMLFVKEGSKVLFIIAFSMLWLSLGGWLSIAPTATAKLFGLLHYSKNYGFLFTGYGVGAVLGNLISGSVRDIFGSYVFNFYITSMLSIIGMIIAFYGLKQLRKS